jgi:hypothetical protein
MFAPITREQNAQCNSNLTALEGPLFRHLGEYFEILLETVREAHD